MRDPSMLLPEEASVLKSRKKKPSTPKAFHVSIRGQCETVSRTVVKSSNSNREKSLQKTVEEWDFTVAPTTRELAVRFNAGVVWKRVLGTETKIFDVEEESFGLGTGLREVEDEVETLE